MRCEQMQRVHRYHDGELGSRDVAAVEAHLAFCPACEAELASLRSLRSRLHALAQDTPTPVDLVAQVRLRVEAHRAADAADAAAARLGAWLTAAAALVLLVCMVQVETPPNPATPAGVSVVAADAALAMQDLGPTASEEQQIALWMVASLSGRDADETIPGARRSGR